ncbi:MAG: PocR ligand-binding domain-containing protein, partial [Verrucomicrobia bacterium]|nr:PocR ligand-binding domain-containing protein [Verrucomicrobiota bacterium]
MPLVKRALIEFRQMTGLAAFLIPASAPQKLVGFRKLELGFCRRLAATCKGGCMECHPAQRELFRRLEGKLRPQSVCCAGGIVQLAVPVVAGGRHLATVVGGK